MTTLTTARKVVSSQSSCVCFDQSRRQAKTAVVALRIKKRMVMGQG
jgi:hypothetical protein